MPVNFGGIDGQKLVSFDIPSLQPGAVTGRTVYVECGEAIWNCQGTNMKDWDRYQVEWPVGPKNIGVEDSVATASLATIFYGPTPAHGCGFTVDNAKSYFDAGSQQVKIQANIAVWSDLAKLIRIAYQVTIIGSVAILEGPGH